MKTPHDPRHKKREKAIKNLFRWSFQKNQKIKNELVLTIIKNLKKIDAIITKAAPEWPIKQINKIDLAILRLAVYELNVKASEPPKVIIDEAIELAKTYGSKKSSSFINGVLGTVLKDNEKLPKPGKKTRG